MAACQVCISDISVFTLEHPAAANSKNFSTDESSTFDESTSAAGIDSSDTEIDEMVREATKKKTQKKKRSTPKTATEEMLAFQMEQFNYQKEQDQKFERCFVIHLNNKKNQCRRTTKKSSFFLRTWKNIQWK